MPVVGAGEDSKTGRADTAAAVPVGEAASVITTSEEDGDGLCATLPVALGDAALLLVALMLADLLTCAEDDALLLAVEVALAVIVAVAAEVDNSVVAALAAGS